MSKKKKKISKTAIEIASKYLPNNKLARGGTVGGEYHEDGGRPFVLSDTGTHIEEEKDEINVPREMLDDTTVYEYKGTNFEILNKILKKGGLSLSDEVTDVRSGDIVICIKSAWDDVQRTYKGTIKQILSAINESRGCNPIEKGGVMTDHETGETKKMSKGGRVNDGIYWLITGYESLNFSSR